MEPFIQNVNQLFQKEIVDIPRFINETRESFEKDIIGIPASYKIYTIISPIFYFFDKYLNADIGANSQILQKFIQLTKIDRIDGLKGDTTISVSLQNHATILNISQYKSLKYLYYSNSGLGIENQLNSANSTCCKLFLILTENILDFSKMLRKITQIIQIIEKTTIAYFIETLSIYQTIERDKSILIIRNLLTEIRDIFHQFDTNILNLDFLFIFFSNVMLDKDTDKNNYYYLFYTFLNYLCSIGIMREYSINELLLEHDSQIFQSHIQKLYINPNTFEKFNFTELYTNLQNSYNQTVYNNLQEDMDKMSIRNEYNNFLDEIHAELDRYASVSKVFKFKRKDIIIDLKPSGLYNYKQIGGSCTFYSYYNLVLNKLFLNNCDLYLSNKLKAVKNVVDPILNIHYIMFYSFCICNDNEYTHSDFSSNKIFHFNYLYNILIKNNFIRMEITRFYPKKSLVIFSKSPLIDTLLYTNLDGYFESIIENKTIDTIVVEHTHLYMEELNNYLNSTINHIRNKNPINILDIQQVLLKNRNNLIPLVSHFLEIKCLEYIKVKYDIYLIYLWYFMQLHAQSSTIKVLTSGSEIKVFYVLEPIYSITDIDTSKCGSQIECITKKCKYDVFNNVFIQNIDVFLNKFHFVELYNLSEMINANFLEKDIYTINDILHFEYCGFIFIEKYSDKYDNYENMIYDSSIFTTKFTYESNTYADKNKKIYKLISLYSRLNYLIKNKEIHSFFKEKYIAQQQNIIDLIKDIMIQNINIKYDNLNFENELQSFLSNELHPPFPKMYLIFILSNKKYLIINDIAECRIAMFYSYLHMIESNTIIIKGHTDPHQIHHNIQHLLNNKPELLNFVNELPIHSKWMANYNLNIVDTNKFQKNSQEYLVVKPDYFSQASKILSRFGCNRQNYHEFIVLFPIEQIDSACIAYNSIPHNIPYEWIQQRFSGNSPNFYYIRPYMNIIEYIKPNFDTFKIKKLNGTNSKFNMFICIKKNKTIIELNFFENNLDINGCFYYKNGEKYKLDFNISLPFRALLSETTPYLCYKNNQNQVFIDVIHTNANWFKSDSIPYINFWSKDDFVKNIRI